MSLMDQTVKVEFVMGGSVCVSWEDLTVSEINLTVCQKWV